MKSLAIRLLAFFGLAPAGTVAWQARTIKDLRAESLEWKARTSETRNQVKSLTADVKRQARMLNELNAATQKLRRRHDELENLLRVRLVEAEQVLLLAREHLMTIDVKLDILEGAANILDDRTRPSLAKEQSGVNAGV